jgi:hypothetical protein
MAKRKDDQDMSTYRLRLDSPRPFFAEVPYYLWGQVNYDSDGDCKSPTDRNWTAFYLTHRDTGERVTVTRQDGVWHVEGADPPAARAAYFLVRRCGGEWLDPEPVEVLRDKQSEALRYALSRLTGLSLATNREWVAWYRREGEQQYPEPDLNQWFADLKAQADL